MTTSTPVNFGRRRAEVGQQHDEHGYVGPSRLWRPQVARFTPAALEWPHGQRILERVEALGVDVVLERANRLTGLRGEDERATYRTAKRTLAVAVAPPSAMKLKPIPPSADWQFHLAEGCPGHCQYCYLAGSLAGPPVVKVFANLPEILASVDAHVGGSALGRGRGGSEKADETSFECSCYTDPLALEHLTGSLAAAIEHVGRLDGARLRWTTKYDNVGSLLDLDHRGRTRARFSVNAPYVAGRFEGGTASLDARLSAARRMGEAGYRIGLTLAPIMVLDEWRSEYSALFDRVDETLGDLDCDLTFELITHRFTATSKRVLQGWYPRTKLDLAEENRTEKRTKFGGTKYVYPKAVMVELRTWFEAELVRRFPKGRLLYWT